MSKKIRAISVKKTSKKQHVFAIQFLSNKNRYSYDAIVRPIFQQKRNSFPTERLFGVWKQKIKLSEKHYYLLINRYLQ